MPGGAKCRLNSGEAHKLRALPNFRTCAKSNFFFLSAGETNRKIEIFLQDVPQYHSDLSLIL